MPPAASYSPAGAQTYPKLDLQAFTATSRLLPAEWLHFRVTSGHMRSRDVIFCHVTTTSCELQPCRSSNLLKTWLTGLLHPLPGDLRSNDITSGSISVTWRLVTSFPVTWVLSKRSWRAYATSIKVKTVPSLGIAEGKNEYLNWLVWEFAESCLLNLSKQTHQVTEYFQWTFTLHQNLQNCACLLGKVPGKLLHMLIQVDLGTC